MNAQLFRAFDALRPEFKRTWERQLRASDAINALALPDLLVPMMDDTLAELRTVAADTAPVAVDEKLEPLHAICRCHQNPLLRYFEAGDLALLSLADRLAFAFSEDEFDELRRAFHRIARRELEYFCRLCTRSAPGDHATKATAVSPLDRLLPLTATERAARPLVPGAPPRR